MLGEISILGFTYFLSNFLTFVYIFCRAMTEGIYLQGRKPRIAPKFLDDPSYYNYRDRLQEFEHDVHSKPASFDKLLSKEQIKEKKDFVSALNSRSNGIPGSSARRRYRQYLNHFEPADRYNPLIGKDLSVDDRGRERESNNYHHRSSTANHRQSSSSSQGLNSSNHNHHGRHSDRNNNKNGLDIGEELSPRQVRRNETKEHRDSLKYSQQNNHSDRERRSKPREHHDHDDSSKNDRHDRHRHHHGHRSEKPHSRDRSHR